MGNRWLVAVVSVALAGAARAGVDSSTSYTLDLTKKEAAKKAEWSEPDKVKATADGLGWGDGTEAGSRDVWVQTAPFGIGLSWRPTMVTSITARVKGAGSNGLLYARYSADGKNWTTWQHLEETRKEPGAFQGTLRVPYREMTRYSELRMEYARRDDVDWASDEEALARDLLKREPKFFEKATPFIGYVQFLYETQLASGERMKGLEAEARWYVGGPHRPARVGAAAKGRDVPWRFKAP